MECFCNAQGKSRHFAAFAVVGVLIAFLAGSLPTPSFATDFTARHIGDFGNVTVMQVAGNYDSELPDGSINDDPRRVVTQEFYKTHKDEYDFLIIFTDFDFKMPESEAAAFYLQIKNDVQGIGLELFDNSTLYGSAGKLQGTVDMGNLANNVADPLDPRFEHTLGLLNHEVLHRWGAFLKLTDASGTSGNALLGKDGDHWNYLLDTRGSLHYGSRWQDNGDGTFTAVETRTYFSPLDLYLMGMLDKSEVPPMLLIENSDLDQTKIHIVGQTISGTPRTVTIEEIIAANGERIPSAAESQKSFKTAFIFVTSSGAFSQADLRKLETVRNGFLTRFSVLTDGQALVQVAPAPKVELASNPGVEAPVKEVRDLPPSIDEGMLWLKGRQSEDGHWSDSAQTEMRDTAESAVTLSLFPGAANEVGRAAGWLSLNVDVNTDYLARKVETLAKAGKDVSALVTELISRQNTDGGWGSGRYFLSNPTDTALTVRALSAAGFANRNILDKAMAYLTGIQNADGGWSETGAPSLIQPTANALLAFSAYRNLYTLDTAVGRGSDFLQGKQNVDGGFGNSPSTVYDTAATVLALTAAGATKELAARGVEFLLAEQSADGSWYRSPYQTAMAMQAVHAVTVDPDLEIFSENITFIPQKITKLPTNAVVNAEIRNLGRTDVPQAAVALYAGEVRPENLLEVQMVAFPAQSSVIVTFAVPVEDGSERLFTVVVDPDNLVREQSKTNNRAANILRPETTYDLEILATDLTIEPRTADFYGTVRITATLRNLGTTNAYHVPLQFFLEDGGNQLEIATLTIDIPANGVVTKELVWKAVRAGTDMLLTAQADPLNAYNELVEENNRASVPLTVNSPTGPNLSISYTDITIAPSPAPEGESATIAAVVKNQGFAVIENVPVSFYLGVPGHGGTLLGSSTVSRLEPGQSAQVEVDWANIQKSGSQIIYVVVDPENLIAEIAEDDNEAFTTLQVLSLPDFSVAAGSIQFTPAVPKEGDPVSVSVTVANAGDQERENVTVQLLEAGTVIGTRVVPLFEGNSLKTFSFDYGAVGTNGLHEVTVSVDPDNAIAEGSESNNLATRTFNVQDGDLWVSEQYISPNGDGVQDSTVFGFRLEAPATVSVVVVNEEGQVVRTFAGADLANTEGGSVTWDGLNEEGAVVPDGEYQMQARGDNGSLMVNVLVVVDNNRSPFANNAVVSDIFGVTGKSFVTSIPGEIGYSILKEQTSWGRSIYYSLSNSENEVTQIFYLDDDPIISQFSKDGNFFCYVKQSYGWPRWWAPYYSVRIYDIKNQEIRWIGGSYNYPTGFKYSPNTSKIAYWSYKDILSKEPNSLIVYDFDKNISIKIVEWLNDIYGDRYKWSHDGKWLAYLGDGQKLFLTNFVDTKFISICSNYQWLNDGKLFYTNSGENFVYDPISNEMEKGYNRQLLSEGDKFYLFRDNENSRIIAISKSSGEIIAEFSYIPNVTVSEISWTDDGNKAAIIGIVKDANSPYYSAPQTLFISIINLENKNLKTFNRGTFSYDVQFYNIRWLDGETILFIKSSYLSSLNPSLIFANSRKGDFFEYAPPNGYLGKYDVVGDKIILFSQYGEQFSRSSLVSPLNLSARLDVQRGGRSIVLSGNAVDLNFAEYSLEYAESGSPGEWRDIKPPCSTQVNNDMFINWTPPSEGTFFVRLTARDRAGNVAWDRKQIFWGGSPAGISGIYKDTDFISPNGDGVKDSVEFHYRALDSVHLAFQILDINKRPIKTIYKDHSVPEDDFIVWDGRDENGAVVPDGPYNIKVLEYEFSVQVDTVPAMVGMDLSPFNQDVSASLYGHAYDPNLTNWLIEFGSEEESAEWRVFAQGSEPLVARDDNGALMLDPIADQEIRTLLPSNLAGFGGKRFRIVAEDAAGNVSSAVSGILPEELLLYSWDGETVSQTLPEAKARAGIHEVLGVETFAQALGRITLQYRMGGTWFDVAENVDIEAGLISIQWDNTPVAGGFNAIRLKAVDATGHTRFSNQLTTASIFSVSADCGEISGTNYLFEDLSDLKYQYRIGTGDWADYQVFPGTSAPFGQFRILPPPTGQTRVAVRMAATGASGRSYLSDEVTWPSSCPATVKLTIEYPEAPCGSTSEKVTLSAQANALDISPKSLSFFLDTENGAELLRQLGNTLSGSFSVDTSELGEGQHNVRAAFTYLDRITGLVRDVSSSETLLVDRRLPSAQITYPAGNSLTICPEKFDAGGDAWHGIPVEAIALDNVGIRRYELSYGAGENPATWLPAMTRSGGAKKPIAGLGSVKGTIGAWDIADLKGTVYTLKLKVVDLAGNVACHTATVSIDTLTAIADYSIDRRLFSPAAAAEPRQSTVGFAIGEPAVLEVDVFSLVREANNAYRLDSQVRSLFAGSYPGGKTSIAWNGRNDGGGIVPDGEYAIVVRATDSCGNTSQKWEAVTVDATSPAATITYPTSSDPLPGIIEVKGTAADPHFSGFVLAAGQETDQASWRTIATGSAPIQDGILGRWNTFGLEGVWTLRLTVLDQSGNERQVTTAVDLGQRTSVIRSLEATPRIFSPNGDGSLDETTVAYEVTEPSRVRIEILGAGGTPVRTQTTDVTAGSHSFVWDGRNSAGTAVTDGKYRMNLFVNLTANPDFGQTETITLTVDSTPPEIAVPSPLEGAFLNVSNLAFVGTVRDPNLQGYSANYSGPAGGGELDSGNQSRTEHTFGQLQIQADGAHILTLAGNDLAGNRAAVSRSFTIDRTPPEVALDSPANGAWYGSGADSIEIAGSIKELNLARYSVRYGAGDAPTQWSELAGGEIAPQGAPLFTWLIGAQSGVPDGTYTLSLHAVDKAGLEGEARVRVTVDNTPPEVHIAAPSEGAYLTGPVEISGTAFDQNLKESVIDLSEGICATAYKWATLKTLTSPVKDSLLYQWKVLPADGNYCLRVSSEDKLGNKAAAAAGFMVDTHPPQAPALEARSEEKNAVRLDWSGNSEPDLAGYNLYRGSQKVNNELLAEPTYLDANLAEGSYSYFVKAIDFAGNESQPSNTVQRKIDLTPPVVKIASPANETRLSNYVDIKGTAYSSDDFREYRVFIGKGETPSNWEILRKSPVPVSSGLLARYDLLGVAEGQYVLRVEAEDLSGNQEGRQVSFTVDNTPPRVPTLLSAVAAGTNVAIAWQPVDDGDLSGYLLFRNYQLANAQNLVVDNLTPYLISGTSHSDLGVPDGTFDYYLVTMDRAGNMSEPSNVKTVTIDTRAPAAFIMEPASGTKPQEGFLVRAEASDQDIASLRLQIKSSSSSTWTDLIDPFTSPPFATWLDPEISELEYGDYQLRALATDRSGKSDPAPAQTTFTYTDLTPPAAPDGFKTMVQGDEVLLTWSANGEKDLAGYDIYRTLNQSSSSTKVNSMLVIETAYRDTGLADGIYSYEIRAVDTPFGNQSASASAQARVYTPTLTSPAIMVSSSAIEITGNGVTPGAIIEVRLETGSSPPMSFSLTADADGRFRLQLPALEPGENRVFAQAVDALGNISKIATLMVTFDPPPQTPTGLEGIAEGYDVNMSWNPNAEADLASYNLYRDGVRINGSRLLTPATATASGSSYLNVPANAIDGNPTTFWASDNPFYSTMYAWFEVALPAAEPLRQIDIQWGGAGGTSGGSPLSPPEGSPLFPPIIVLPPPGEDDSVAYGRDYLVQGWSGREWVTLATTSSNFQKDSSVRLASAFTTARLRVYVTASTNDFLPLGIVDLSLLGDGQITGTSYIDVALADGKYLYQVTAVDGNGFESPRSDAVQLAVGDVAPPAAPQGLTAAPNGSGVHLNWSPGSATDFGLAGYNLFRQTVGGWQKLNEAPIAWPSFVDEKLANGTYVYQVTAVDLVGNESNPAEPAEVTVSVQVPVAPGVLGVIAVPEGNVLSIEWEAVGGVAGYNLFRAQQSSGPYGKVNDEPIAALSLRDENLENGKTYFYVVTAVDTAGNESPFSAEVQGVPTDTILPPKPFISYPASGGSQVVLHGKETDLAGQAEPGSKIEIYRGGIPVGTVFAARENVTATSPIPVPVVEAWPSPEGTLLAFEDTVNALWLENSLTGEQEKILDHGISAAWSPDGSRIVLSHLNTATWNNAISFYDLNKRTLSKVIDDPGANIMYPSWSRDGTEIAFSGFAGGIYGVWKKDLVSGELIQISGGWDLKDVKYSPDGKKIAFREGQRLRVFDNDSWTNTDIALDATNYNWNSDGKYLVFESASTADVIRSEVVDPFRSGLPTLLKKIKIAGVYDDPAFAVIDSSNLAVKYLVIAPAGNKVAFAGRESNGSYSVRIATLDGKVELLRDNLTDCTYLEWKSSGEIVFADTTNLYSVYPEGNFRLEEAALQAGENLFYAISTDESGNQGPSSESLSVIYDTSRLPDLSVRPEEIFVYPPFPRPGEKIGVDAVIRNDSAATAENVKVDVYLWDAAGNLSLIHTEILPQLAPHGEKTVSASMYVGSVPGKNTVILVLDPNDEHDELRKSNNTAAKEVVVTDQEQFQMFARLDGTQYRSRQVVDIEVSFFNSGNAQVPVLDIAIQDDMGRLVHSLGPVTVEVPYGSPAPLKFQWNTGATFAGNYRLQVKARNLAGLLAEQIVPFIILPDINVDAAVTTGKATFGANEKVNIDVTLKNAGANNILSSLIVKTGILDGQNVEVYRSEKAVSSLWPGMQSSLAEEWNTGLTSPGAYQVQTEVYAGGARIETAAAPFTIAAEAILSGEVTIPANIILAGNQVKTGFTVRNSGNAGISGILRASIIDPKTLDVLATDERSASLPQGTAQSGEFTFSSQGLALQTYQVVLRFTGGSEQKTIGAASFTIKDGTPPELAILSPQAGEIYESAIPLDVRVADHASGVARVEYQIDAGEWGMLPLSDPSSGRYSLAWEPAPQDGGTHGIRFRAFDQAGNVAESPRVEFEVQMDKNPPVTTFVLGVPHFSTPESIFVSDRTAVDLPAVDDLSGVARTEYSIDNGQWQTFSSKFNLSGLAEGQHRLSYRSADNAGNFESASELLLVLDNTAPALEITIDGQGYMAGETARVSAEPEIVLSASDALSGVRATEYRFDEEPGWTTYHGAFRLSGLDAGSHTLHVRSFDNVENVTIHSVTIVLIRVEVMTEVVNLPRVLIWTRDPADITDSDRPTYSLEDIRTLASEIFIEPDAFFTVITEKEAFKNELRSGVYNMIMILDHDFPFDAVFLREMREAVYRGTGLMISHWQKSVDPILQDLFGIDFKGSMAMSEGERSLVFFPSPLAEEQSLTTTGRILRTRLAGGILAGIAPAESTCKGLRKLAMDYKVGLKAGDRVTVSLSVPQGKKLNLIDAEEVNVGILPAGPTNQFSGNTMGDLAISSMSAQGLSFAISAPYGYLEDNYSVAVTVERVDGTRLSSGPVSITPTCGANLQAGVVIGPFTVQSIEEDRVRVDEDVPAVVLSGYGEGKTVFFSYNVLAAALSETSAEYVSMLRRSAGYLLPEAATFQAGGVALLQTKLRIEGTAMQVNVVEKLGEGLTHVPLFSLTKAPLEYTLLADGGVTSFRYFVRTADRAGTYGKETEVLLGLDGNYSLFDRFAFSWPIDIDSASLTRQAISWVEEQARIHPECTQELTTIREALNTIFGMPRTTKAEVESIIHLIVQTIHKTSQLPFDATALRTVLGEYLRIVEGLIIGAES
jgi:flagellar hook assembly protein FlgD/fibronectin type 3 domain-containing protein